MWCGLPACYYIQDTTLTPHSALPQVHLMYQRLPVSARPQDRPEPRHLNNPVIKVFSMVAGGPGEYEMEMEDLMTGQYIVCAEVRLGNTSLQSHCAQARVANPGDSASSSTSPSITSSTTATNSLGLPIILAITIAGLAFLVVASYSVYSLVVRNRRIVRER